MYYTYTSSCTSSYDECTIRSLRKDNADLFNRNRNIDKANDHLTDEIRILRDKLKKSGDYVRELKRDATKARRLKTALNDFMGPEVETQIDRAARKNATFCENYGGTTMAIKVTKPRYNVMLGRWV